MDHGRLAFDVLLYETSRCTFCADEQKVQVMEQVTITITTSTDKMRSQPAEQIAQALHSVAHRVLVHGWPPEGHGGMVVTPIYDTKGERCGEMIVAPVPASRA